MTKEESEKLKDEIDTGYHNPGKNKYPPYALTAWDDRNRFREYVFRVIESFTDK